MGAASAQLRPLVDAIWHHLLAVTKLHADDTPVPVLVSGNGKIESGRLWTYVRDDRPAGDIAPPAEWFAYSPDHKGIHPQTNQAKFDDALQAYGYAGFNALFEKAWLTKWPAVRMRGVNSMTCMPRRG
ncbi:IS66 family transposase [Janthinobacterium sp. UMAB-56]|uniref:IS66 family transposase n=1 Tax=Janthinobacterium sp. UMAB-56 TaxID=1365361 RepID=UPI00214C4414|nr:IS66 family transposase [Janthinobacterium sp. UMAB-56]